LENFSVPLLGVAKVTPSPQHAASPTAVTAQVPALHVGAEADVRAQVVEIFALREIAPAITVTPVDPRPVDVSALISACPAATAVMIPVELTVAIAGAEEDQVTVPVLFVIDSWVLRPAKSVTAAGVSSSWSSGPDELSHATTRALKTAVCHGDRDLLLKVGQKQNELLQAEPI
jgi:hypothetical protein